MRIKTNTVLFWVFLVMPALISAIIAAVPKNSADPLVGLSILIWIVSSLYCGIWIGVKLSQSTGSPEHRLRPAQYQRRSDRPG